MLRPTGAILEVSPAVPRLAPRAPGSCPSGAAHPVPMSAMPDDAIHVLVVDDLPDKRLALTVALEPLDVEIVTAECGAEALRQLLRSDRVSRLTVDPGPTHQDAPGRAFSDRLARPAGRADRLAGAPAITGAGGGRDSNQGPRQRASRSRQPGSG